jgi:hypothetical protein
MLRSQDRKQGGVAGVAYGQPRAPVTDSLARGGSSVSGQSSVPRLNSPGHGQRNTFLYHPTPFEDPYANCSSPNSVDCFAGEMTFRNLPACSNLAQAEYVTNLTEAAAALGISAPTPFDESGDSAIPNNSLVASPPREPPTHRFGWRGDESASDASASGFETSSALDSTTYESTNCDEMVVHSGALVPDVVLHLPEASVARSSTRQPALPTINDEGEERDSGSSTVATGAPSHIPCNTRHYTTIHSNHRVTLLVAILSSVA